MRVVLQRVSRAAVRVEGETVAEIGRGLLALVGIAEGDDAETVDKLAAKAAGLRIFADASGRFGESVGEAGGAVLVVSQFTLISDLRKGRRPSFTGAARPEAAECLHCTLVRWFCRKSSFLFSPDPILVLASVD